MLGSPTNLDRWLASRFGVDASLLLDSGTSALRLALESIVAAAPSPLKVALPAYGCYDLATSAIGARAEVVFYDLDPGSLGPDWLSLEATLTAGARAIVLVHQYGVPADIDRARALCDAHGAVFIEDAAQGTGAWWGDRRLGAHGDLGILSFGRGKGMTAGGGGALLARGRRGTDLLEGVRGHSAAGARGLGGWVRLAAQALLSHPLVYRVPARLPWLGLGETPYHKPWTPRTIDTAQAAAVEAAAGLADREAEGRRRAATRLGELLQNRLGIGLVQPPSGDGIQPGWLRFPVLLDASHRGRVGSTRSNRLGVIGGYPATLPRLPEWTSRATGEWPGAARLAAELVTLPTHRWVRDADRTEIVRLLTG